MDVRDVVHIIQLFQAEDNAVLSDKEMLKV